MQSVCRTHLISMAEMLGAPAMKATEAKAEKVAEDAPAMKALKAKTVKVAGDAPAMEATKFKAETGC